jgi:DNA (cytosine-5)-methyltransferase 1
MLVKINLWFVKSKRAQSSDDDETWVAGGVAPTLNAFDNGDTRATVIVIMREREGKSGGGKGFLLSDRSFTLATNNFQTVFLFEATRVEDVRIYEDYSPTVARYWGTGGARVPYVYAIQGTVIGRQDENGPQGKGFADDGEPMFTLDRVSGHAVAFQLSGDRDDPSVSVSDTAYCLPANPMSDRGQAVAQAFSFDDNQNGAEELMGTLMARTTSGGVQMGVSFNSVVRRLTPTECERLQGFPDGWTDGQADSHRYKQMGNAVAVPVVQWIINRLTN